MRSGGGQTRKKRVRCGRRLQSSCTSKLLRKILLCLAISNPVSRPLFSLVSALSLNVTAPQVIGLLKNRLGASGVQLGRKLLVDGREILEYIAASEGREDMIGQVRSCDSMVVAPSTQQYCKARSVRS